MDRMTLAFADGATVARRPRVEQSLDTAGAAREANIDACGVREPAIVGQRLGASFRLGT